MRKVFVNLSECMPGMQMAESVYNEYGAVVVAENTILDDHLIRKLDNLGHYSFKIVEQSEDVIISNDAQSFNIQYNENIDEVKGILHEISVGKNINAQSINNMSDSIISRINENRDVVGCINQIRSVDEYTYTHGINVSLLCMLIGKWMKLSPGRLKDVVKAGLLHDIGKTKILPDVLNKPSKLTEEEYGEIKKHAVHGYRLLESSGRFSKDVCTAVLMHHEREDGTGYPIGLKGDKIHEFAKIIAVADIYDAMTSDRPYREKESPFEVFELMENQTFGVLDHTVVNAFLSNIAAYYIGDFVVLNTGEIGEIVYINPRHISQPVVKIGDRYIDMSLELQIKITELI